MDIYSVNEICDICHVTRKQLRYYEERGLISNVLRHESNNYRYYTEENIYEIVTAKALRNVDMSTAEIHEITHGNHIGIVQEALRQRLSQAREEIESGLRVLEQSSLVYARLSEALTYLKLHQQGGSPENQFEIVELPEQNVVSLSLESVFKGEGCQVAVNLPQIQQAAQEVNAQSFGALIYCTYDHFDSNLCEFNNEVHRFKMAVPVQDRKKPSSHYDTIPAVRGVSAVHIGSVKNTSLIDTYVSLMRWARDQGLKLANWSIEEWLISPMITANKDFWVIQIVIPILD